MVKIIKFAKESWLAIVAILALLVIQANCELALPQYTSDIVDVGIQSGGIETAAPEAVRASTLEHMKLFLTDEEAARTVSYTHLWSCRIWQAVRRSSRCMLRRLSWIPTWISMP